MQHTLNDWAPGSTVLSRLGDCSRSSAVPSFLANNYHFLSQWSWSVGTHAKDITHPEQEQQHPAARQLWVERCNANVSEGKDTMHQRQRSRALNMQTCLCNFKIRPL